MVRAVGQKQNNRAEISTKLQCSVFVWAVRTWLISLPPDDSLGNNIGWRPFTSPQWLIGMQKNFYFSLWQTKKFKSALIFSCFYAHLWFPLKGNKRVFSWLSRSQNAEMNDVIFSLLLFRNCSAWNPHSWGVPTTRTSFFHRFNCFELKIFFSEYLWQN